MRVLVLNHNLQERGTYFRSRRIARALHARGHEVTFVCTGEGYYRPRRKPSEPGWNEWESANWTPLRDRGDGYSPLGLLQRIAGISGRFDLVYTFSHLPVDQGTARFLGKRAGFWMTDWCDLWNYRAGGLHDTRHWPKPLPDSMRGLRGRLLRMSFALEDRLEVAAARDADAVSIISTPMRRYTRKIGVPDRNVLHLVSGSDTETIRPLDKETCRRELGLPADALILGYVANVTPDNDQLEGALKRVWDAFPEMLMISAGPKWYGADGVVGRAVRLGRLIDFDRQPFNEIPRYLGAADFLVMPLRDLPFNRCRWPNKFGDYMASGRATATCEVGDMARVTRRFHTGTVGPPSPEGLAAAMQELAGDENMRRECGKSARHAAETAFDWDRQVGKLVRFLKNHGLNA